jgi:uncharacterized iron-regulated membrane protein
MKNTFRASMTWLHTWCGLFLSWVLFAIFVTGTASYYRPEITQWMQPELQPHAVEREALLDRALDEVRRNAPDATTIYIRFPTDREAGLQLNWETPNGTRTAKVVDAATARIQARDSRGGEFFYRFHFQLQLPYPWGRYIACLAAAFMLVALLTGIIAHRQFFKDFFTFRPSKPGTRSWLDIHNLSGVIALPFYLMIAYSAQIIFVETIMPWGQIATEPPSLTTETPTPQKSISQNPEAQTLPSPNNSALPASVMMSVYRKHYGDRPLAWLYASGLGTPAGRVSMAPAASGTIAYDTRGTLNFNASTGTLIPEAQASRGIFANIHDVLYGLHMIRFAEPGLRALFFFLGLLGSVLCATGLIMWTIKRRKRQENLYGKGRSGFGHWIVERLNIATIVGFPIALVTIFWANRLLPIEMAARGDREVNVVFVVWALTLLHACLRPAVPAWREQLWMAASLFTLLPFVDALTTAGLGGRFGFNLTLLGLGGLWAWAALRLSHMRAPHSSKEPDHLTPQPGSQT